MMNIIVQDSSYVSIGLENTGPDNDEYNCSGFVLYFHWALKYRTILHWTQLFRIYRVFPRVLQRQDQITSNTSIQVWYYASFGLEKTGPDNVKKKFRIGLMLLLVKKIHDLITVDTIFQDWSYISKSLENTGSD